MADENKKVCLTLPKEVVAELEKIKDETGLPVAQQVSLALKGYKLCKIKDEPEVKK